MSSAFLLYGAAGFVGEATARTAIQSGLKPVLAGRDAVKLGHLAKELGVEYRAFRLEDAKALSGKILLERNIGLLCSLLR
jgi:saccharopine dehydrogenase (NAD+, L-lysine-forming)